MSDVDDLLAAWEDGTLLRPDAAAPNLVEVARAVAATCGVEGLSLGDFADSLVGRLGAAPHLVLLLADGLGLRMLERNEAPFLREQLHAELQAPFPSSTAPALTSLATGEWPARHAVTGWWTHLPEIGGASTILHFRRRSDDRPLGDLGIEVASALPVPSQLPRFRRRTLCLFPEAFADGDYSRYWSGETPREGYRSLDDAGTRALAAVAEARADGRPSFTYVYLPHVDRAAHDHGVESSECGRMVRALDALASAVAEQLEGHAVVAVTSDHGHLRAAPHERLLMREPRGSRSLLACAPAGDLRVGQFHTAEGAAEEFAERFRERFGASFLLLTTNEVDELRLLGPEPLSEETRARLGDFTAISRGRAILGYQPLSIARQMLRHPSHHAGLTPDELLAPLVLAGPS